MSGLRLEAALRPYVETDYVAIDGRRRLVARVLRMNPEIDALLEARGAAEAVFVTAWNPRSRKLSDRENTAANGRLAEILEEEGLEHLPHEGLSKAGDWREEGFLVFDLPPFDALQLAETFDQNAIVWQALGQPAQVLFTRLAVEE